MPNLAGNSHQGAVNTKVETCSVHSLSRLPRPPCPEDVTVRVLPYVATHPADMRIIAVKPTRYSRRPTVRTFQLPRTDAEPGQRLTGVNDANAMCCKYQGLKPVVLFSSYRDFEQVRSCRLVQEPHLNYFRLQLIVSNRVLYQ